MASDNSMMRGSRGCREWRVDDSEDVDSRDHDHPLPSNRPSLSSITPDQSPQDCHQDIDRRDRIKPAKQDARGNRAATMRTGSVPCEKSGMENQMRICVWSISEGARPRMGQCLLLVFSKAQNTRCECLCGGDRDGLMDWSGASVCW